MPMMIHQGATFLRRAPLGLASPALPVEVALVHPELVMIIDQLGHPRIAKTIMLNCKQTNLFADISAPHYWPWQFYNVVLLALGNRVKGTLLFGSNYRFTTPRGSI